jgi:hypothetical protein
MITSVNIDQEIIDFCGKNHINLSEWIRKEFARQYFSLYNKVKELEELQTKLDTMKQDIQDQKTRMENMKVLLTQAERRYLANVPAKIKAGFKIQAMLDYYNNEFSKDLGTQEFLSYVELYKN